MKILLVLDITRKSSAHSNNTASPNKFCALPNLTANDSETKFEVFQLMISKTDQTIKPLQPYTPTSTALVDGISNEKNNGSFLMLLISLRGYNNNNYDSCK